MLGAVKEKKIEEKGNNKKHIKLLETYKNNIKISDKNLGNKFEEFEDSRLDESKTLLFEIENKPKKFQRYFRGQIVRVKFGVNICGEFSGEHFAIVISKNDTISSSVLHVIPLTSKVYKKIWQLVKYCIMKKKLIDYMNC